MASPSARTRPGIEPGRRSSFAARCGVFLVSCLFVFGTGLPAQQPGGGSVPRELATALGLSARGLHSAAERAYTRFLESSPRHPRANEARYRRGVARLELSQVAGGIEDLEAVVDVEGLPWRAEGLYRLAGALVETDRARDALRRYEQLLKVIEPDHYLAVAAAYAAGELWAADGRRERAVGRYDQAASWALAGNAPAEGSSEGQGDGYAFAAAWRAAQLQYDAGESADAARRFAALLERHPGHPARGEICHLLGEAHWSVGDVPAATAAWRKTLAGGGQGEFVDDALYALAWCELEPQGRGVDAALGWLDRLVRDHRDSPLFIVAQLERGRQLLGLDRAPAAGKALDAAWKRSESRPGAADDETRAEIRHLRGLAALAGDDARGALDDLRAAAAAEAEPALRARRQLDLGRAQARTGDVDAARATLQAAIAGAPSAEVRAGARDALISILHERGQYAAAREVATALLREAPEHPGAARARFAIASSFYAEQDFARARKAFQALPADHPRRAEAVYRAAWCAWLAGDAATAAAEFEGCAKRGSGLDAAEREESLAMRALALRAAGDAAGALAACDRYKARYSDGEHLSRTERVAAAVLQARGENAAAAERLAALGNRARGRDPETTRAVDLQRADALFATGDFAGAARLWQPHAGHDSSGGARAAEGLAWCAFETGDDRACRVALGRALTHPQLGPDPRRGLLELAVALAQRAAAPEQVVVAARTALAAAERGELGAEARDAAWRGRLRWALGVAQLDSGDPRAARRTLERLSKEGSAPELPALLAKLGAVCLTLDDTEAARGYLQTLAWKTEGVDDDLLGRARLQLGELLLNAGEQSDALRSLRAAGGASAARARFRAGQIALGAERLGPACDDFAASAAAAEEGSDLHGDALFALGETAARAGQSKRAVAALRDFQAAHPRHDAAERAALYLGETLLETGDFDGAVKALRGLRRVGDDPEAAVVAARAALALGRAEVRRNRAKAALAAFARVAELDRGALSAEAAWRTGEVQRQSGDAAAALDTFVQAAVLHGAEPWVPRCLLGAARLYVKEGRTPAAIRLYDELLQRFPTAESAAVARKERQKLGQGDRK